MLEWVLMTGFYGWGMKILLTLYRNTTGLGQPAFTWPPKIREQVGPPDNQGACAANGISIEALWFYVRITDGN